MFIRIVCITTQEKLFEHLLSLCWEASGLFRWEFVDPCRDTIDNAVIHNSQYIIVNWPVRNTDRIRDVRDKRPEVWDKTQSVWARMHHILKAVSTPTNANPFDKVFHFIDDPLFRLVPPQPNARVIERKSLTNEQESWSNVVRRWIDDAKKLPRPVIKWDEHDLDLQEIESSKDQIALAVEKYFPKATQGRVIVDPVIGGRSGTPLVRLTVPTPTRRYALKLFETKKDFEEEWQAHDSARQWLGELGVPLYAVPEVPPTPQAQASAFPSPYDEKKTKKFPICYHWAGEARLLADLYQDKEKDNDFVQHAYHVVLATFQDNQDTRDERVDLRILPFAGPLVEGTRPETCHEALVSPMYRRWLRTARNELKQKGLKLFGSQTAWDAGMRAIEDTLNWAFKWLDDLVDVRFGRIHGDPNARNLLFNSHVNEPADLRLIDFGRFKPNAPLVIDLVFLEADIKFALLATEEHRNDYFDWDTQMIKTWCAAEDEAIKGGLDYAPSAANFSDSSVARAYTIIGDIRRRAKEVSPDDPKGRAYFFYLLFWSLRQIRSWSLPPTKRLFALYSASQICQHLMKWPNI